MKKLLALILALIMVFAFAACAATPAKEEPAKDEPAKEEPAKEEPAKEEPAKEEEPTVPEDFKVAVLTGSLTNTPFCVSMGDNIYSQFEETGWQFDVFDADMDATKQSTQFETAIMMEPDVIVYWCRDSAAAVEDVKKAAAAGIPVITLNNDIAQEGWEYTLCFVGPNQYQLGYDLGTYLTEQKDSAKIAIIDGLANNTLYNNRYSGFMDAIKDNANYEVLVHDYCNADRTTAQTMTENYITGYADMDTIVYFSDNFALGGINAIEAAGKSGQYMVLSIDGMQIGFDAVAEGKLAATVLQTPGFQVAKVIEIIKDVILGDGSVSEHQQFSGHYLITADNYTQYKPEY